MKGIILLAVFHIVIIYQARKKGMDKNATPEPAEVVVKPHPAPPVGNEFPAKALQLRYYHFVPVSASDASMISTPTLSYWF